MPRKLSVRVRTLAADSSDVSEDDEDGSGSETLDTGAGATESDEDEGQSSGQGAGEAPGGFTSVEVDSGLLTRQRMVEKTRRRGHRNSEAKDMDALLTEKAREEGRLQPRSLSEVTDRAQDGVLLREGEKFMCRQEVLLRIREENEFGHRFFCTHWNRAHQTLADGRPKKKGRIKSAVELSKQRQRAVAVCSACGHAGHISTNRQCKMHPKNPARRTNGSAGAGSAGAGSRRDGNDAQSEHAGAAPRSSARPHSQARETGKRDRGSAGATASDSAGQKKMRRKK